MVVSRLYSGWSSAGGLGDLTASLTLLLFNVIFLLGSITDAAYSLLLSRALALLRLL